MAKLSLDDRLNQIEDKISEKSFRENKGLGNEVGYYIFDYDPREELYVRNHIAYLKDRKALPAHCQVPDAGYLRCCGLLLSDGTCLLR